jgi:DNA topoisomerase VI subunit A
LIDWDSLFSVAKDAVIADIYAKSRNDYYVATDSGVFKTIYSYELINDIEQRNEYELQAVVDSLQDDLDTTFEY